MKVLLCSRSKYAALQVNFMHTNTVKESQRVKTETPRDEATFPQTGSPGPGTPVSMRPRPRHGWQATWGTCSLGSKRCSSALSQVFWLKGQSSLHSQEIGAICWKIDYALDCSNVTFNVIFIHKVKTKKRTNKTKQQLINVDHEFLKQILSVDGTTSRDVGTRPGPACGCPRCWRQTAA